MAYKIPVTKEQFLSVNETEENEKKKKQLTNSQAKEEEKKSENLKEQIDYIVGKMQELQTKSIDQLASEKYEPLKLERDNTSDEELFEIASEYANAKKSEKEDILENNASANKSKVKNKQDQVALETEQKIDKINALAKESEEKSKNNAIKNGIARSSIIEQALKENEKAKNDKTSSVKKIEETELNALNQEIANIEEQLQNSLKTLDMQTAVTLNDELLRLKKERDKKNEEVAKHNMEIDQKIQNYAKELSKTEEGKAIKDYIENRSGKYVVDGTKLLIEYFDNLPKDKAYSELESEEWKKAFGSKTFNMLKNYLDYKFKNGD